MGASAFVVICVLAFRDAAKLGWNKDHIADVIFWTAVTGIACSRLLFWVQNPGTITAFGNSSRCETVASSSTVPSGAFRPALRSPSCAGCPSGPPSISSPASSHSPTASPGWAALARGCCYGAESDVPWAVHFTHPLSFAPDDAARHPTQLYEAAGLFTLFAALTWLRSRKRFDGEILIAYLGGYALLRMTTELFRGDADRRFLFESVLGQSLSTSQGIGLACLVGALIAWRVRSKAS